MSVQRRLEGAAALVSVIYMRPDGGQYSLFPNSRGIGLNVITMAMMPKGLRVSQMETWLSMFMRSGHQKIRRKRRKSPGFVGLSARRSIN